MSYQMKYPLEMNKKVLGGIWIFLAVLFAVVLMTSCGEGDKKCDIPERPSPATLVNDYAGVLSKGERQSLEAKLVDYANASTTQIVVVTVKSLCGYEVSDYAFKLGDKWGVGQKDKDNGVVIIVKPKTGDAEDEKGKVFIAPGRGLEGVITDLDADAIVQNEMIPSFKSNNYYAALDKSTTVLMGLASKEFTAAEYKKRAGAARQEEDRKNLFMALIGILVFVVLIGGSFGYSAYRYSRTNNIAFWAAVTLMMSSRNSHSGHYGRFRGGGGGFGGSGGGFGGFGGGGFGGGGAGGSW
jgi:uncharacterized protein